MKNFFSVQPIKLENTNAPINEETNFKGVGSGAIVSQNGIKSNKENLEPIVVLQKEIQLLLESCIKQEKKYREYTNKLLGIESQMLNYHIEFNNSVQEIKETNKNKYNSLLIISGIILIVNLLVIVGLIYYFFT